MVFGQSIPTAFHLSAPHYGIRQAAYRAENAGGIMADGYARIANRVSVVTAQNGPAATLLVPPLAEALKASIPVVALVQEVPRGQADKNAFQEFDHVRLFDLVAKWVRRIDCPERIDDYVDMAFTVAASGRPWSGGAARAVRRPVPACRVGSAAPCPLGLFPLDRSIADPKRGRGGGRTSGRSTRAADRAPAAVCTCRALSAALARSNRRFAPGRNHADGQGLGGRDASLSLGVVGYFMGEGSRTSGCASLVDEADVILFVGARTNQNGTDSWTLFPAGARYVHLDIDGAELGRNYEFRSPRGRCQA